MKNHVIKTKIHIKTHVSDNNINLITLQRKYIVFFYDENNCFIFKHTLKTCNKTLRETVKIDDFEYFSNIIIVKYIPYHNQFLNYLSTNSMS